MDSEISVEISRLYVSFFNRAADPDGLQYWMQRYNEAIAEGRDGKDFLEDMADSFAQSPEAKDLYEKTETPTDAEIEAYIVAAYMNMFGREPDPEGLAYWTARWQTEMADGKPGVRVLFEIENAARGSSNQNDIDALQNKAEVAAKFANDFIASGAEWTPENMEKAKTIVDGVDHTPESVQQAEEDIAEYVEEVTNPDGGQEPGPVDPDPVTPPPVDTGVDGFGAVNVKAQDGADNLWVGSSNSASNFNKTTTTLSQVELALKGYHRGVGDVAHEAGVYKFRDTEKAGFAFSVASLGEKSIAELMSDGYSFHLKIDNDGGFDFGDDAVELTLDQLERSSSPTEKAQDSGYDWVTTDGAIVDDEGDGSISAGGHVTQNIQTPVWYGQGLDLGGERLRDGEYSVSLEMRKDGKAVATETIVLDVVAADKGYVGTVANVDGMMLNGTNNPADKFNIVELNLDQIGGTDLILGLGGQQRGGPAVFTPTGGNMSVDPDIKPALKWSVESSDGKSLADILADYDIVLSVDTDRNGGTTGDRINFTAELDANGVGLDWTFQNGEVADRIIDDAGNATVSQNIQALSWLLPIDADVDSKVIFTGAPASAVAPGEYFAFLTAYDKSTDDPVGTVGVVFDVGGFE